MSEKILFASITLLLFGCFCLHATRQQYGFATVLLLLAVLMGYATVSLWHS